ncbi:COP1-INTERACTIVE PROTEIN 1 [Salix purpurea]|uniref:COP1-INTERACTIVE PROTEIN 1 n=1 Tax=Salix purpurea TaxID=77065 RepID=A0A9Q0TJ42_SALPP|nr:COP1-INTERACTIVE PROTEIN 1 [Salix purpurea]
MENHIQILYQRILVAKQIHAGTKDGYKKIKERLDQANIELNEKISAFEAELRKIREMLLEPVEDVFSGAEVILKKLNEGKEEKELLLREEVGKLKAKLNSVSQVDRKLVYLEQQVKDKEEVLLELSEEKREATRQLFFLIDYHRGHCHHLIEMAKERSADTYLFSLLIL